jgi:hypothetical protein
MTRGKASHNLRVFKLALASQQAQAIISGWQGKPIVCSASLSVQLRDFRKRRMRADSHLNLGLICEAMACVFLL